MKLAVLMVGSVLALLMGCAPLNYDRRLDAAQLRCDDLAGRRERAACRRNARSAKTYEEFLKNGGSPI